MRGVDSTDVVLIVVGVLGAIAIVSIGFVLDRRSQRTRSAKWLQGWTILTRVRNEMFNRLHGPLRLQDQRAAPVPKTRKRKPATPRRKPIRKVARSATDPQD